MYIHPIVIAGKPPSTTHAIYMYQKIPKRTCHKYPASDCKLCDTYNMTET